MRRLLLAGTAVAVVMAAGSASAADLRRPVYQAAPAPMAVFSWTGWYVGVHVGGAWGTKEWSDPTIFDGFTAFTLC
jgi:outer membrane immunogenic protein